MRTHIGNTILKRRVDGKEVLSDFLDEGETLVTSNQKLGADATSTDTAVAEEVIVPDEAAQVSTEDTPADDTTPADPLSESATLHSISIVPEGEGTGHIEGSTEETPAGSSEEQAPADGDTSTEETSGSTEETPANSSEETPAGSSEDDPFNLGL